MRRLLLVVPVRPVAQGLQLAPALVPVPAPAQRVQVLRQVPVQAPPLLAPRLLRALLVRLLPWAAWLGSVWLGSLQPLRLLGRWCQSPTIALPQARQRTDPSVLSLNAAAGISRRFFHVFTAPRR